MKLPINTSHGISELDLTKPVVMGILNVTPDSFSDGGLFFNVDSAFEQAKQMIADGAKIIDIGGESTRPGAAEVSVKDELSRVVPIIKRLSSEFDVIISIDTSKPEVMQAAVEAGAHIINDVRALQLDGALNTAAALDVPVCIMHMQGQPKNMQDAPSYRNVTDEVCQFLDARIAACLKVGIKRENIILDPGFGFGKTLAQNYELLANVGVFHQYELPLLIGVSRKSMIGNLVNRDEAHRLAGSLACATIAAQAGAHIFRVHDVPETVDALAVVTQLKQSS